MLSPKGGTPETLSDWQSRYGRESGTLVTDVAPFADPDGFDFTLIESPLTLSVGFAPLPDTAAKPQ